MIRTVLILTALGAPAGVSAAGQVEKHWGYSGKGARWVELGYVGCAGRNQSPVDLATFVDAELPAIAFSYRPGGSEVVNNGHTVQVNYAPGSSIRIDGVSFELKQFHFHAPSENHVGGKSFPMEAHLVHADADGNLAVLAVMFEEGAANAGLEGAWAQMPKEEGEKVALATPVDVDHVLPLGRDYYRFSGSLTTPPCSEGVRWLVLKEPATASRRQIADFESALLEPNNRPLQSLNARVVLR